MTDEQALGRYVRTGDAKAFAALVHRYERLVFSACTRHLLHEADRLDACQETFLRLSQRASDVNEDLGGWLHKVAVNVCVDRIRADVSRRNRERLHGQLVSNEAKSPDALAMQQEALQHFDQAIASMDASDRQLLVACGLMGTPQCDLAERLGVSEATVSRRLQKAMERLRTSLEQRGVVLSLAALSLLLVEVRSQAAGIVLPLQPTPLGKLSNPPVQVAASGGRVGLLQLATVAAMAVVGVGMGQVARQDEALDRPVAHRAEAGEDATGVDVTQGVWQRATLPIALEGYWLLETPGRESLQVVLDAHNGTLGVGSINPAPSPGSMECAIETDASGRLRAVVLADGLDPERVGHAWEVGFELVDPTHLKIRFDGSLGAGHVLDLKRIGPSFPLLKQVDSDERSKVWLHVADRCVIKQATLAMVLREMGVDVDNPLRTRVIGSLPADRFDTDFGIPSAERPGLMWADATVWLRRAIETELGWQVRQASEPMDCWVLQAPEGGAIQLHERLLSEPRRGGSEVQGNVLVTIGGLSSWMKQFEATLGRVEIGDGLRLNLDQTRVRQHGVSRVFRYEEPWPSLDDQERLARFLEVSGLELVQDRRVASMTVVEKLPVGTRVGPMAKYYWQSEFARVGPGASLKKKIEKMRDAKFGLVDPSDVAAVQGNWEGVCLGERFRVSFVGPLLLSQTQRPEAHVAEMQTWPTSVLSLAMSSGGDGWDEYQLMQVDRAVWVDGVARMVLSDALGERVAVSLRVEGDRMQIVFDPNDKMQAPEAFDGPGLQTARLERIEGDALVDIVREVWPQVLGECPPGVGVENE